eukprot:11490389-Karenia_brevis.AAC.1
MEYWGLYSKDAPLWVELARAMAAHSPRHSIHVKEPGKPQLVAVANQHRTSSPCLGLIGYIPE